MHAVIEELHSQLERDIGRPLAIEFGTSASIRQRLAAGESFDVAVATAEVIDDLANSGKVAVDSVADLGLSGIGIGVRAGVSKPDVRTPEAIKQALLDARSVTWVGVGASRVHIERMLETLGITSQMQPKIVLTQGVNESLARLVDGQSEMILTLASEILPAEGVQYVGPLPASLQNYVAFSAGVSPSSYARAAGAAFISALGAPAVAGIYAAKGMELPAAGRAEAAR
jgi:molybdate transport system substrate-binding protein